MQSKQFLRQHQAFILPLSLDIDDSVEVLNYLKTLFNVINPLDQLIIDSPTIGIDESRLVKDFLSTTPVQSDFKLVAILFAQHMTLQAQQALLKILEEPPEYARIVLCSHETHTLLPTVLSRCVTLSLLQSQSKNIPSTHFDLEVGLPLPSNLGDRLLITDKLNLNKQQALNLTQSAVSYYRRQLRYNPSKGNLYNITLVLYTRKLIRANTNIKLAIDNMLLKLK